MEQHPVPQNIASYQFRLVGNMTLKQFLELAAGCLLALIFYKSNLPVIFKWPLMGTSIFIGIILAFFPFEERPLDAWVINFFKSVYRPTLYLWKKQPQLPDFFFFKAEQEKSRVIKKILPEERLKFAEYLESLPKETQILPFDKKEEEEIKRINQYLALQTNLKSQSLPVAPAQFANVSPQLSKVTVSKLQQPEENLKMSGPVIKMAEAFAPRFEIGTPFKIPPPKAKLKPKPQPVKKIKPKPKIEIKKGSFIPPRPVPLPQIAASDFANVVVGMVITPDEKILPGAIIEIRDATGMPIRASKTNKLGQFFVATPLANGNYEMEIEHPNYTFDIIKFKTEGKVLAPFKIKAKTMVTTNQTSQQLN